MSVAERNNHIKMKYRICTTNSSAQKCQLMHTLSVLLVHNMIQFVLIHFSLRHFS